MEQLTSVKVEVRKRRQNRLGRVAAEHRDGGLMESYKQYAGETDTQLEQNTKNIYIFKKHNNTLCTYHCA